MHDGTGYNPFSSTDLHTCHATSCQGIIAFQTYFLGLLCCNITHHLTTCIRGGGACNWHIITVHNLRRLLSKAPKSPLFWQWKCANLYSALYILAHFHCQKKGDLGAFDSNLLISNPIPNSPLPLGLVWRIQTHRPRTMASSLITTILVNCSIPHTPTSEYSWTNLKWSSPAHPWSPEGNQSKKRHYQTSVQFMHSLKTIKFLCRSSSTLYLNILSPQLLTATQET